MSTGSCPSYHVPAIPRWLLLPGLDTYKVQEEELPDPTPTGSHVSNLQSRRPAFCAVTNGALAGYARVLGVVVADSQTCSIVLSRLELKQPNRCRMHHRKWTREHPYAPTPPVAVWMCYPPVDTLSYPFL